MKLMLLHLQPGGTGYYRHTLPARALKAAGHTVSYFTGYKNAFAAISDLHDCGLEEWLKVEAPKHDILHTGYSTVEGQVSILQALRNFCLEIHSKSVPIITDIDDDIINVPHYNTAFKAYIPPATEKKIALIHLRNSDLVTVSTPPLANLLKLETNHTTVLPNFCNPDDWPMWCQDPRRDEDKSIRLLFAGGQGHLGDLSEKEEIMHKLMEKYDGSNGKPFLRLFFLGCTPPYVAKYMPSATDAHANRCFYLQGSYDIETYWKLLTWVKPDILWAPISHNTFNESKSSIKAYDAAMSGAAFICEDWATYDDIPTDCALKAYSPLQWQESLEHLIEDTGMRKRLHTRLLEWVLDCRQIKTHIHLWQKAYEEALSRPVIKQLSDTVRPRIIRV